MKSSIKKALPRAAPLSLLFALLLSCITQAEPAAIVLIIDDLGNDLHAGLRTVNLNGAVTCAILPHTPNAPLIAQRANYIGKDVIVHAPMSSVMNRKASVGQLSPTQSYPDFVQTLRTNIAAVPHARGLNNHMGSELTQQSDYMGILMSVMIEQGLFFIDSRTSAKTVAADMAQQYHVQHLSRDIFLDNKKTDHDIHKQFQQLLKIARRNGLATAIGHPYPSTLKYLERVLPTLEQDEGIVLISSTEAMARQYRLKNNSDLRSELN